MTDPISNQSLFDRGYRVTEGLPAALTLNGAVIAQSNHSPNLWSVARGHVKANSEGAVALRAFARALKGGRR